MISLRARVCKKCVKFFFALPEGNINTPVNKAVSSGLCQMVRMPAAKVETSCTDAALTEMYPVKIILG